MLSCARLCQKTIVLSKPGRSELMMSARADYGRPKRLLARPSIWLPPPQTLILA